MLQATATITRPSSSGSSHDQDPDSRQDDHHTPSASEDWGIVPSACTACRGKHLKCDGGHPCSRCQGHGFLCYRKYCVEGFFHFFHKSHPFLHPREHAIEMLRRRPVLHLETAMCCIGSQYVSTTLTANFALELETLLASPDIPNDGFLVQALLLFAIGLDGNNEQTKAFQVLSQTQKLAIRLGMHQNDFATLNSEGSKVLEESWRRTWWELYVVSGLISGLHQISTFHLCGITTTVGLPCEEDMFRSGSIPTPHTIDEFDNHPFTNENLEWSSYTYRIAAVRNLGRVLQSQEAFPDNQLFDRVENQLANWRLHLPNSKQEYFDLSGQVDELLFQAHMITHVSAILLHRQFSQLNTSASQSITSCAPHARGAPGSHLNGIHTVRTVQSATDITRLISLPGSLVKHTHFFTCAIALASIIHLSCWSVSNSIDEGHDLEGLVRMSIGGLKAMANVWPSAQKVLSQVTRVAQEIFVNCISVLNVPLWNALEDKDIESFAEGENIGNDFQFQ
ncbi:hypothetical protein OIDMADRAFT_40788 [Oidiodendron maius Zn]|uniref:Zn(2)-C6 fungal-type domain-containing protein n=1 Tax=Oidiodendron maius (strain Zn) TaxID=913774 RepID=A0A0C3HJC5_OIDMZ|nr:hypothetical protein OIDMADRAFT_40788 [Oidiodendron maius Zn]